MDEKKKDNQQIHMVRVGILRDSDPVCAVDGVCAVLGHHELIQRAQGFQRRQYHGFAEPVYA